MTIFLTIGLAIMVGVGLFVSVVALTSGETIDLSYRLAHLEENAADPVTSIREQELRQPLMQRVILPAINRFGVTLSRRIGSTELGAIQKQLDSVGYTSITASGFLTLRIVGLVVGIGLGALADGGAGLDIPINIVVIAALAFAGFILPKVRVDGAIRKRKKAILRALPAALDLLTICVQGGLSFDAALQEVGSKYHNEFSAEVNIMLNEVRLGRPRREALRSLEQRIDIYEVTSFIDSVLQSEQLGSSIADALTIQSEEIRRRRRQRAEELGQKAPIKMLLPLVGCVFPTIFVMLLGPAALIIIRQVMGIPQ